MCPKVFEAQDRRHPFHGEAFQAFGDQPTDGTQPNDADALAADFAAHEFFLFPLTFLAAKELVLKSDYSNIMVKNFIYPYPERLKNHVEVLTKYSPGWGKGTLIPPLSTNSIRTIRR